MSSFDEWFQRATEEKVQPLTATLAKQYSDSEEPEKIIQENWRNHAFGQAFNLLTLRLLCG